MVQKPIEESKHIKSLWERFQDQKHEPWPFLDFQEFKAWYLTQQKRNKEAKERMCGVL